MLEYDLAEALRNPFDLQAVKEIDTKYISKNQKDKEDYIELISNKLGNHPKNSINVIDVREIAFLECIIKGIMGHIYSHPNDSICFAFLNCRACEMVNIVRLFSLFYNRQAENKHMKNVQIYIRGQHIGEELLFWGETLPEVEDNIAKTACMRGILFDNYRVLHDIFRRDDREAETIESK